MTDPTFPSQALDVVRQTKVAQLLAEDVGSSSSFAAGSVVSSVSSLNGGGSKTSIESEKDDPNDDKKNGKREKTFSRLKRTLSSRGQKLMEKMGASGTRLQRSSSRDNLAHHAKLSASERISRSTPMLAQPQSDPDRGRSGSVSSRGAHLGSWRDLLVPNVNNPINWNSRPSIANRCFSSLLCCSFSSFFVWVTKQLCTEQLQVIVKPCHAVVVSDG